MALATFLLMMGIFVACHEPQASQRIIADSTAFVTINQTCLSCHQAEPGKPSGVAPSLGSITAAYLETHPQKEGFVQAMSGFLSGKSESGPLMKDAIVKYGPMPNMSVAEEEAQKIAAYIYDYRAGQEEWYARYYPHHLGIKAPEKSDLETGKEYAMKTKSVLGKQLLAAIKEKGTAGAVDFCSGRAVQITDSMSKALGVFIQRKSHKNRNPQNRAEAEEMEYIKASMQRIASGEKAKPQLKLNNGKHRAYYPILTDEMCLQCHGKAGSDIKKEVLEMITKKYPADSATGFSKGELRGIWVVEWE